MTRAQSSMPQTERLLRQLAADSHAIVVVRVSIEDSNGACRSRRVFVKPSESSLFFDGERVIEAGGAASMYFFPTPASAVPGFVDGVDADDIFALAGEGEECVFDGLCVSTKFDATLFARHVYHVYLSCS